ncbi:hypothetical protein EB796_008481 [Bugula neritina]|uniref:Uncharacterized protein n=1 Tax=Bugula neritina TaxID=10212 RepID=A0A7J7K3L3_BUGNE|nr:hypothetical protein EB796_008481 [Bugula neritina]
MAVLVAVVYFTNCSTCEFPFKSKQQRWLLITTPHSQVLSQQTLSLQLPRELVGILLMMVQAVVSLTSVTQIPALATAYL